MNSHPEPPDGYSPPEIYNETSNRIQAKKILLGIVLGVTSFWIIDLSSFTESMTLSFSSPVYGGIVTIIVVLSGLVFLPVHEYLHALANRRCGYSPQIAWEFPNPNVTVRDEFVKRSHALIALLTPLAIISPIGFLGVQLASDPFVSLFFGSIFVLNTTGSAGDVYNSWSVFRRPQGTRWYMPSEGTESYIYLPDKNK